MLRTIISMSSLQRERETVKRKTRGVLCIHFLYPNFLFCNEWFVSLCPVKNITVRLFGLYYTTCNKIITHPLFDNAGSISIRVFNIENHNSVRNMSSIHRLNKTLAQIICLDYSFSFSLVDTCSRQMIFRTLTAANDGMKRQFSISNNVDEALHSSHSFRRNDTVKKRRAVTLRDWNGHRQRIATYIQSIYGWKSDLLFSYSSKRW